MLGKLAWKVTAAVATGLAAAGARIALTTSWRAVRGAAPPTDAADLRAGTGEALVWAGASAAAVALSRAAAARGAAQRWQRATGSPPPLKLTKRLEEDVEEDA